MMDKKHPHLNQERHQRVIEKTDDILKQLQELHLLNEQLDINALLRPELLSTIKELQYFRQELDEE